MLAGCGRLIITSSLKTILSNSMCSVVSFFLNLFFSDVGLSFGIGGPTSRQEYVLGCTKEALSCERYRYE